MRIYRVPPEAPSVLRFVAALRHHRLVEHRTADGIVVHLTKAQAEAAQREIGIDEPVTEGTTGQAYGIPFVVHEEPQPQCQICWLLEASVDERQAVELVIPHRLCEKHQAWADFALRHRLDLRFDAEARPAEGGA